MADKDFTNIGVFIDDLLEKEKIDDFDLLLAEDNENTKKVTFRNLRTSLVEDDESPSNFRIYSSEKVQKMIDDSRAMYINDIGSMHEDIEHLGATKVDITKFEEVMKQFDNEKIGQATYNEILQALDNKRNKTDLITSADIETGNDADKIHIENLGLDVLAAMTGNTKVTVPSVP